jgi:hypothetical protein
MKEIYKALDLTEAYIIKGILQAAEIEVVIRGESLGPLRGMIPMALETNPAVWLVQDEDLARAQKLLTEYHQKLSQEGSDNRPWTCSGCGEESEPQFTDCWNCGLARTSPYR